jgi:hypothetical protein
MSERCQRHHFLPPVLLSVPRKMTYMARARFRSDARPVFVIPACGCRARNPDPLLGDKGEYIRGQAGRKDEKRARLGSCRINSFV